MPASACPKCGSQVMTFGQFLAEGRTAQDVSVPELRGGTDPQRLGVGVHRHRRFGSRGPPRMAEQPRTGNPHRYRHRRRSAGHVAREGGELQPDPLAGEGRIVGVAT